MMPSKKQKIILLITTVLLVSSTFTVLQATAETEYILPPPESVDMLLEESIFRRMSIRNFTDEPITDQDLSTFLWASYGYQQNGNRTVPGINNQYTAVIYILKEDAVYTYNPVNHSLILYKTGDYRSVVGWQYQATLQIGIAWDTTINSDENHSAAEIGQIGQNMQFIANALNLGTVVTAEIPSPLHHIDLPSTHIGRIVLPLGHPSPQYHFTYRPMWMSLLPKVQYSNTSLTQALEQRTSTTSFTGEITKNQQTQIIWSSYGYSYLFDISKAPQNPVKRHRTVPSAHGYYPLRMYLATENGIYRYYPNIYDPLYGLLRGIWRIPVVSFLQKITSGDHRTTIAETTNETIATAPLILICVLDLQQTQQWDDLSKEQYRWLWFYEAGAAAHNILLEGTAQGLSGSIFTINDTRTLQELLGLHDDVIPLLITPLGASE